MSETLPEAPLTHQRLPPSVDPGYLVMVLNQAWALLTQEKQELPTVWELTELTSQLLQSWASIKCEGAPRTIHDGRSTPSPQAPPSHLGRSVLLMEGR